MKIFSNSSHFLTVPISKTSTRTQQQGNIFLWVTMVPAIMDENQWNVQRFRYTSS